jgi:hypothetical protein
MSRGGRLGRSPTALAPLAAQNRAVIAPAEMVVQNIPNHLTANRDI